MVSIVSWNTQGNPLNDGVKKGQLDSFCQQFDVILLQECGNFVDGQYNGRRIIGMEQAGAFNNRCSTSILVASCDSSGFHCASDTGRALVYINTGNMFIGTIHCKSGGVGGTDLTTTTQFMAGIVKSNDSFVIGGDFNCEPKGFQQVGSSTRGTAYAVHAPNMPTHKNSGKILDWFVSNAGKDIPVGIIATNASDHNAVSIVI